MRWDDDIGVLLEDLEQQAEGLHLADRDAEVADRSQAEYAQVGLEGRLRASVGTALDLLVAGAGPLSGTLVRVGEDWLLLETGADGSGRPSLEWVVLTAAVIRVHGLGPGAVSDAARRVADRLGVRSVLRGLAESQHPVLVLHRDGSRSHGQVSRVGADFAELVGMDGAATGRTPTQVLPFGQVAAVRRQ